jgi:competence ComEA-like helix-hairpin-helix protein
MMNNMTRKILLLLPLVAAGVLMTPAKAQGLPDGEGRAVYENVCGSCHGADIVVGAQGTKARWEETVEAMKARGAYGSDEDFVTVVKYLTTYFGMPVPINTADSKAIQDLGLTEAEAQAVVAHRTAQGAFKTFDDVTKVAGVDKKKLELVKTRITFMP